MVHVRDVFSALFAYVLLFEQENLYGPSQRSYEEVRGPIETLLEQAKTAAQRQRLSETVYQDACFAVVAWINEIVVNSTWEHRNRWKASPLPHKCSLIQRAGHEFFERLKELRPEQKELREIFYYCMGLGFRGQYPHEEDVPQLTRERLEQGQHLSLPVEDIRDITTITPQPYEVLDPKPPSPCDHRQRMYRLLKAGLMLLVAVPLLLLLIEQCISVPQYRLTIRKEGTGTGTVVSPSGLNCGPDCIKAYPRESTVALTPVPAPDSVFGGWRGDAECTRRQLSMNADKTCTAIFNIKVTPEKILGLIAGRYPCAKITVDAIDEQTGSVRLGGRIASEAQRDALYQVVQNMPGVTHVTDALQILPPPLCQVLDLMEPLQDRNHQQGIDLTAELNRPGNHPQYVHREKLTVDITTPGWSECYVYVDYYGTDGMVTHLFPDATSAPWARSCTAHSSFRVDGGLKPWTIRPPFGVELITVIASKTPLKVWPRKVTEQAEPYINELRRTLPQDEIVAVVHVLTTKEKP